MLPLFIPILAGCGVPYDYETADATRMLGLPRDFGYRNLLNHCATLACLEDRTEGRPKAQEIYESRTGWGWSGDKATEFPYMNFDVIKGPA